MCGGGCTCRMMCVALRTLEVFPTLYSPLLLPPPILSLPLTTPPNSSPSSPLPSPPLPCPAPPLQCCEFFKSALAKIHKEDAVRHVLTHLADILEDEEMRTAVLTELDM